MSLHLAPVRFREAAAFVGQWHRHHCPPHAHVFSIGAADDDGVLHAVVVGRPVARHFDDGTPLDVTRSCTDGSRNANSLLYGAAWRAAKALGDCQLITYSQEGESGASLRGAGWTVIAQRLARPRLESPLPSARRARNRTRRTDALRSVVSYVAWDGTTTELSRPLAHAGPGHDSPSVSGTPATHQMHDCS